ncbi:hypothetical protein VP01_2412g5 [Puccinia sorghi]|uniref:DDE Tnp4 domain-containing protein n=1 Tax=Puccinia sorghi TaxID=27349 RepID=A0A0L6V8H1_9BASI|nr:hypothetical protein VP01_2412g5 [Puccinia sorghi]
MASKFSNIDYDPFIAMKKSGLIESVVLILKNLFQVGYRTINLYTTQVIKFIYNMQSQLASWPTQEEEVELSQRTITNLIARRGQVYSISLNLVCDDHAMIAMYSQSCVFLSSLKTFLIKISFFWKTQLIQVIEFQFQLPSCTVMIKDQTCHWYSERNYKEMKDTIKWIISCVVLHNLLEDLKDQ